MDEQNLRRDEFEMYLKQTGLKEFLVKVFEKLLSLQERPRDPLIFLHDQIGCNFSALHQTEILKVLSDETVGIERKMHQLQILLQQNKIDHITATQISVPAIVTAQENVAATALLAEDTNGERKLPDALEEQVADTSVTSMNISMPIENKTEAVAPNSHTELPADDIMAPNDEAVQKSSNGNFQCGIAVPDIKTSAVESDPFTVIETVQTINSLNNTGDSLSSDDISFYNTDDNEITVIAESGESIDEHHTSSLAERTFEVIDDSMEIYDDEMCLLVENDESFSDQLSEASAVLSTIQEEDEEVERDRDIDMTLSNGVALNENNSENVDLTTAKVDEAVLNEQANNSNGDDIDHCESEAAFFDEDGNRALKSGLLQMVRRLDRSETKYSLDNCAAKMRHLKCNDVQSTHTVGQAAADTRIVSDQSIENEPNTDQSNEMVTEEVMVDQTTNSDQPIADSLSNTENVPVHIQLNQMVVQEVGAGMETDPDQLIPVDLTTIKNDKNVIQSNEMVSGGSVADMEIAADQPIADDLASATNDGAQPNEIVAEEIGAGLEIIPDQPIIDDLASTTNDTEGDQPNEMVTEEIGAGMKIVPEQPIIDDLTSTTNDTEGAQPNEMVTEEVLVDPKTVSDQPIVDNSSTIENVPVNVQNNELVVEDIAAGIEIVPDQPITVDLASTTNDAEGDQPNEMVSEEIGADMEIVPEQPIIDDLASTTKDTEGTQPNDMGTQEVLVDPKSVSDQPIVDNSSTIENVLVNVQKNDMVVQEITAGREIVSDQPIVEDDQSIQNTDPEVIEDALASEVLVDQSDTEMPDQPIAIHCSAVEYIPMDAQANQELAEEFVANMNVLPIQSVTDDLPAIETKPMFDQINEMVSHGDTAQTAPNRSICGNELIDTDNSYASTDDISFTDQDTPLKENPFMGTPIPAKRNYITSLNLLSSSSTEGREATPNRELFDLEMEFLLNHQSKTPDKEYKENNLCLPLPKRLKCDTDDDWLYK